MMEIEYSEDSPFYRLLTTKYDEDREVEALEILQQQPQLAILEWPGPDELGKPFVKGSTALHYAANDGKLQLANSLIDHGADINASNANWYRSVLSWAANNARIEMIKLLLSRGADPMSLDAMHAAAWGGSDNGRGEEEEYITALRLLIEAGADFNDRRHYKNYTPLQIAIQSGHTTATEFLRSLGASEK